MFDELAKVEARAEIETSKSDLDKILDAEGEIIKQYEKDKRFALYNEKNNEAYLTLFKSTQKKLADVSLTPELLQNYIDARDNPEENTIAIIRGMYSAALLEIISTITPETYTFIDGRGKTFNYLFYHIHNVKNLILQNITGNHMLSYAGSHNGNATNITLNKIIGDCTLLYTGSDNGSVENIRVNKIKGNHTLRNAGRDNGSIKNITTNKIKGHSTLYDAGINNGSVENILEEHQLTEEEHNILSRIETIVETIHTLSLEEQKKAHDEIARLQTEIFSEVT